MLQNVVASASDQVPPKRRHFLEHEIDCFRNRVVPPRVEDRGRPKVNPIFAFSVEPLRMPHRSFARM